MLFAKHPSLCILPDSSGAVVQGPAGWHVLWRQVTLQHAAVWDPNAHLVPCNRVAHNQRDVAVEQRHLPLLQRCSMSPRLMMKEPSTVDTSSQPPAW